MEQFVLGIFQEQLSKFLVGFKKEQVNANLLNGKGEIRDVNLNCSFINDLICKITPHIVLDEIRVSKLGFNVTSWTNIKKAPIVVDIEDVYVTIVEPLKYTDPSLRLTLKQLSGAEFKKLIKDQKPRGQYNLFDRILDNLQIEIRAVHISFQTRGRFKTERVGPWTPPRLCMTLRHLKYCSVNEFGNEGTPEDCWRHNRFDGNPNKRTLLIYKKASMGVTVSFQNPKEDYDFPPLLHDAQVEVQIAIRRKWINGDILAIQVDATMNQVEVNLDTVIVPTLAHAMVGMQYCFMKDRGFDDPLLPETAHVATNSSVEVAMDASNTELDVDDDDTSVDDLDDDIKAIKVDDEVEPVNSRSYDDDEVKDENNMNLASKSSTSFSTVATAERKSKDDPVIVLPSGIAIHEKLSISLSIQDCKVRGTYLGNSGYIQLQVKGLVAELIWPKVTKEKGCYLQLSLSYITIQENLNNKVSTILRGGIHQDARSTAIESPSKPRKQIPHDENFPLFEDRSVRHDPLALRHSFPAQAVGLKATISHVDKVSDVSQEELMVLNEMGIDLFEIILDSEPWGRALRFVLNEGGKGFDPRWHSGDWSNELNTGMLVHPSQALVLSDHLQMTRDFFLDENEFLSSDLFNLTLRVSNILVKVPAAVQKDIRSCDIMLALDEVMLVVSSALPRTFLSGKIGSSVHGDGASDPAIVFPNDPNDLCYTLQMMEDPVIRQHGSETLRRVSTFRFQVTTKGLSLRLVPIIPFCDASEPRNLLSPLDMTMIFCFEGEPPTNPDDDLIKIVVFQSLMIHSLEVNCDFDLITGAISSITHHTATVSETIDVISKLMRPAAPKADVVTGEGDTANRIRSTIGGRRVMVKKQLERSRRTGGLSVEIGVQLSKLGFNLWRQNVPQNSRFRASVTGAGSGIHESPILIVKLMSFIVEGVEVGLEVALQQPRRHILLKSCISELHLNVCDLDKVSAQYCQQIDPKITLTGTNERDIGSRKGALDHPDLLESENPVVAFERAAKECGSDLQTDASLVSSSANDLLDSTVEVVNGSIKVEEAHPLYTSRVLFERKDDSTISLVNIGGSSDKDILIRLEDKSDGLGSLAGAIDMDVGGVISLHIHHIENFFLLLVEALLMPTEVKSEGVKTDSNASNRFPEGSVGYLLWSLLLSVSRKKQISKSKVHVRKIAADSTTLDQFMHALVLSMLPDNIGELLVRFVVSDLNLFVPHHPSGPDTSKSAPWLGHQIREISLLSAYIGTQTVNDSLVQRLGKKGITWGSLFGDQECGFHHNVQISQALYSAELQDSGIVFKNALIDSFDLGLKYGPRAIDLAMGDSTLSLNDLSSLRELYSSFVAFVQRSQLMVYRMQSVTTALARADTSMQEDVGEHRTVAQPKTSDIVDDAGLSLELGRQILEKLKIAFELHYAGMRAVVKKRDDEIERLRVQVFLKERSRIAALALVSCQAAGWLRVGGTHMTGERSPSTASMWRYHCVLRKSLLLLYAGPGKPRPLDVLSLHGAQLLTLAGGRRKRDIKNGFAIRESTGCIRYIIAPNSIELETWIESLQNSIIDYSEDGMLEEDAPELGDIDGVVENKATDEERLRARTLSSEIGATSDDSVQDAGTMSKRGSQIRERLAKVSASTRNTIGTAVQAAKERRHQQTVNRDDFNESDPPESVIFNVDGDGDLESNASFKGNHEQGNVELFSSNSHEVISDHATGVEDTPQQPNSSSKVPSQSLVLTSSSPMRHNVTDSPGRPVAVQKLANLRFNAKDRLSSAMQGAKEKALAVAEERRRRQHEKDATILGDESSRKGFGLRGRLENVAATVKKRIDQNDSETISEVDVKKLPQDNHQQHGLATEFDSEVATADNDTAEGKGSTLTDAEPWEEDVSLGDDGSRPKVREQLRDKFTKLGAAVKIAASRSGQGEDDGVKSARFSIRRNRQSGSDESDMVKLKAIRIDAPIKATETESPDENLRLFNIKGNWIVRVKSLKLTPRQEALIEDDVSKNETTQETNGVTELSETLSTPSITQVDSDATEESHPVSQIKDLHASKDKKHQYVYCVQVISQNPESHTKINVETQNRSFQDVIGLFIDVMESISAVPPRNLAKKIVKSRDAAFQMHGGLALSLGIAPLDIVNLTGDLLGGLLSASFSFHSLPAFHEYQCELLSEFLNAALSCSMPIDACTKVLEFLSISGGLSVDMEEEPVVPTQEINVNISRNDLSQKDEEVDRTREIMSLVSVCLSHLMRAESNGILAQKLAKPKEGSFSKWKNSSKLQKTTVEETPTPFIDPLLPSSISDGLRSALHSALNSVMKERDEAHAQLIATSILHVHEMEGERKQAELAKKKLKTIVEQSKQQQGLFSERFKDTAGMNLQKYLEQMVKNSDSEITDLSRQLARELSEKTAANLEIIRLKESLRLERETDLSEKEALADELRKARWELAEAKDRIRTIENEAQRLREVSKQKENQT